MKKVAVVSGAVMLGYFAGCFCSAGFDISQWSEGYRLFTFVLMVTAGIVSAGIVNGIV